MDPAGDAPRPIANSANVGGFGTGGVGSIMGPKGFFVPVIWGLSGFAGGGEALFVVEPKVVRGVDAGR